MVMSEVLEVVELLFEVVGSLGEGLVLYFSGRFLRFLPVLNQHHALLLGGAQTYITGTALTSVFRTDAWNYF